MPVLQYRVGPQAEHPVDGRFNVKTKFVVKARMTALAGLGLSVALALGACASSDETDASTPGGSGDAAAGTSTVTEDDVKVASEFIGGTPGAADPAKPPIKVGLVANVEGPTAQPYLADTAEDVADFVNEKLGGVGGGHPLEFVRCTFGGTAEQGQLCGQKFANDPEIKFVFFPGGTTGGPQLHAANNGTKAVVCTVASPADANAANTFCTTGGPLAAGAMVTYLKDYVKAKTVSIITLDDPTLASIVERLAGMVSAAGMEPSIGLTPAGATDVTQSILASKAQTTDATMLLMPNDVTCIPFVKAFKSLSIDKPVVALPGCTDDTVKEATGDYPQFTFYEYGPNIHIENPQMSVYLNVLGASGTKVGANGPQVFGSALLVAKLINELGAEDLTTDSVAQKLAAFTGPAFLGDDVQSFGNEPLTSVGSLRARFFTYEGDGEWTDATDGTWLSAVPQ